MNAVQATQSKFLVNIHDLDNAVREVVIVGKHEDGERVIVKEVNGVLTLAADANRLYDSASHATWAMTSLRKDAIATMQRQLAELERLQARTVQVR
jgi:hypothetical protein